MIGEQDKIVGKEPLLSKSPECYSTPDQTRKARLWDLLRPTLNHDLPNMLVALQGLLQMLKLEQEESLNPAGQDYLQRLLTLSQKLQNTSGILKSLNKSLNNIPLAEPILLSEFIREVAAACKKKLPKSHLTFHTYLKMPQVVLPRLLLQQMLVEMVRLLASSASEGGDMHCCLASRSQNGAGELFLVNWMSDPAEVEENGSSAILFPFPSVGDIPSEGKVDYNFFCPENYLSMVLIEEIALSCRSRLTTLSIPNQGKGFLLTIPG